MTEAIAQALALATLIQVVATASVLGVTDLAPYVAADLGIGAHRIGYQISLIYAAGVVSSAVAGSFVMRHGPERVERLALLLFGFGLPALATGRLPAMLLALVAIGLGYGLNNPAASEMLSRVTPKRQRNIVFSMKRSGVPLGGILSCSPCRSSRRARVARGAGHQRRRADPLSNRVDAALRGDVVRPRQSGRRALASLPSCATFGVSLAEVDRPRRPQVPLFDDATLCVGPGRHAIRRRGGLPTV